MSLIETAIAERRSCPKLEAPAPDAAVLDRILGAAITAPDHGRLKPWRFLVIEDDGLSALGELFVAAESSAGDVSEAQEKTLRGHPHRAPMILVAVASIEPEHKIPVVEQQVAVGCAVQNALLAAEAAGFGAYWRTGPMAYHPKVKSGLGLGANEEIIGFVYIGSPGGEAGKRPSQSIAEVTQRWAGTDKILPWK
jgi:nitroreductase